MLIQTIRMRSTLSKLSSLFTFLLFPIALFSQENKFSPYTQDLSGTDLKFDMIAIPAGEFMMGSPENEAGRHPDEGPLHSVKINAFGLANMKLPGDLLNHSSIKIRKFGLVKSP